MQQLILSDAQSADTMATQSTPVEQLVWMGTAYGRRAATKTKSETVRLETADTSLAFRASVTKTSHRLAVRTAYAMRALGQATSTYQHRNYQTAALALLAVCAALAAAAIVQSFVPDNDAQQTFTASVPASDTTAAPRSDLAQTAVTTDQGPTATVAQSEPAPAIDPASPALAVTPAPELVAAKAALERSNEAADAAAAQSKSAIESERTARLQAEEKATLLSSEMALHKTRRENAEASAADIRALLETERKARAEAELAARTAQDELMRKVASQAPDSEPQEARVAMATPEPVREPITPVSRPEPRDDRHSAPPPSPPSANISSNSTLMTQALREGQNLLAKGELTAARKQFEKAAVAGLPEGALALGETFDPVALSKAGFQQGGNAARAREWYRRAHELARNPPKPHRQAHRIEPQTQSNLQIPRLE